VDVLHLFRAGTQPAELAGVPANRLAYAQFCDAVAGPPAPADLPAEARSTRLHLGEGVIPLHDILDVLPEHTPLVIETPVAAEAAWPTARRQQSAAADAQAFFQRHLARKGTLAA
jgi:sugar phosphate isomerase/epimerase